MKRKVGDIAIEVMKEEKTEHIGYTGFGLLDKVFERAKSEGILKEVGSRGGMRRPHPMNRHQVILNCLDRDKRFEKFFVRVTNGRAEVSTRHFKLFPKSALEGNK